MNLIAMIATIVTLTGAPVGAEYPQSFTVTDVDRANDIVTFETYSGHQYLWEGCEDWEIGDRAAAIMNDAGSPETVIDDVIVQVRYTGR